jgi:hypothetical protein
VPGSVAFASLVGVPVAEVLSWTFVVDVALVVDVADVAFIGDVAFIKETKKRL